MTPSDLPAPTSRIAAYFIDCGLVLVYLGLLTAVTRVLEGLGGPNLFDVGSALAFQGTVFMTLVLPAWIYLAWCESSAWQATVGKRLLKLQVVTMADQRATFWQTTIRGFIKLVLPWELAHSVLNTNEGLRNMKPGQPLHLTDPTSTQLAVIGIVWVLIIWYAAAIFLGARRPVYDLLAGTKVIRLSTNTI